MRICVVGTGYVGLVTGTCLAETGNQVTCMDVDEAKIEGLAGGRLSIFEHGLREMVIRNLKQERLSFYRRPCRGRGRRRDGLHCRRDPLQ